MAMKFSNICSSVLPRILLTKVYWYYVPNYSLTASKYTDRYYFCISLVFSNELLMSFKTYVIVATKKTDLSICEGK